MLVANLPAGWLGSRIGTISALSSGTKAIVGTSVGSALALGVLLFGSFSNLSRRSDAIEQRTYEFVAQAGQAKSKLESLAEYLTEVRNLLKGEVHPQPH